MPFVNVRLAVEPSIEVTTRTIEALTDLTVRFLGKERPRTTVVVDYVPWRQWSRGGAWGGFFVEAKITAGTNSPGEKARYVHEASCALQAITGLSGYVAIDEIDAGSWGHGGETQEARMHALQRSAHVQAGSPQG